MRTLLVVIMRVVSKRACFALIVSVGGVVTLK